MVVGRYETRRDETRGTRRDEGFAFDRGQSPDTLSDVPNTMNTPKPSQVSLAIAMFNDLPRKKGKGRLLTEADFINLQQAREITGKPLGHWNETAIFIKVETLVELYRSITRAGRKFLANEERIGGWFGSQGGDLEYCDEDGCFCSTPSHSEEVPSVDDYREDLEWCAENGLLFIYPLFQPEPTPEKKTYRVYLRYLFTIDIDADSEQEAIEIAHRNAVTDGDCETLDEQAELL